MATDNVKRYFARAWENEMPATTDDWQHEPIKGLLAGLVTYIVVEYTERLKDHCIERILLRSFPQWAEKRGLVNNPNPKEPKRLYWPVATVLCSLALRLQQQQHLWWFMTACMTGSLLCYVFEAAMWWGFEHALLISHKVKKCVGWVPYDEPWDYAPVKKVSFQSSPEQSPSPPRLTANDFKTRWIGSTDSPIKAVRERLRQLYEVVSPKPPTGYLLRRSGEGYMESFQSITAEDETQAKSFEELRFEHYQDKQVRAAKKASEIKRAVRAAEKKMQELEKEFAGSKKKTSEIERAVQVAEKEMQALVNEGQQALEKEGQAAEDMHVLENEGQVAEKEMQKTPEMEQDQSWLGSSLSFLTNSFLGNSMASRDSFGRSTIGHGPLLVDGAEDEGDDSSQHEVPDLLTGTPRKLFT